MLGSSSTTLRGQSTKGVTRPDATPLPRRALAGSRPIARPQSSRLTPLRVGTLTPPPVAPAPESQNVNAVNTNTAILPSYTKLDDETKAGRPRIVILGSGWGAMSVIKALPNNISEKYEVVVISPRNYFLYTPLLPAVATGTMEERSIVEPVRAMLQKKGAFFEANCKSIDPIAKQLVCCFPGEKVGMEPVCFQVNYDVLVVSVGSVNNTFGIQGVEKYCHFFKSIGDAGRIRRRVSECFERASLPATPVEERRRLLSFVIVGGGPTGVEVAAEMYDMIEQDLVKLYPNIIKDVQIQVVELMDHVLSTYDRAIGDYTNEQFRRSGIRLVLNSRVTAVEDGRIVVENKNTKAVTRVPFGVCIWATGIAKNPLIQQLQSKLPAQTHFRSILTDDFLCVKGSNGSIFAIGDASTIDQPKALERAEQMFDKADTNKKQSLTLVQLRGALTAAAKEFSHLEEHARFLDSKGGFKRWGNMVANVINKPLASTDSPLATLDENDELSKTEFKELLGKIDSGLRALPATAQVAKQQGEYVADLFKSNYVAGTAKDLNLSTKPFKYSHKGSAAYVGNDRAVFDVPTLGPLTGFGAGVMWKGFETYSQFSFRNQCLVASDWLRTKIFGRDISRV